MAQSAHARKFVDNAQQMQIKVYAILINHCLQNI